jgi:hypothetical protein
VYIRFLDVLNLKLLVTATLILLKETLLFSLLLAHVVIKSETNFLFNNWLRLGYFLSGLALSSLGLSFSDGTFLSLFSDFLGLSLSLAPVTLSVATFLVTAFAATSSILTI